MHPLKRIYKVLKHTGAIKIFFSYLILLFIGGAVLRFIEPGIHNIFEGFYFTFVASTTIGFGDIAPVTVAGRIITVLITIAGILTVAMVPGVVVAYYTEYLKAKENDTISTFLEKLEHLPELSKDELEELSEKVRAFNGNKKKKNKHSIDDKGDKG